VEDKSTAAEKSFPNSDSDLILALPDAVVRSHFFPGLGWMISRVLWAEMALKWPLAYWDDWMRDDAQRLGRDCIRPEVSRSITFGIEGASSGSHSTYYDMYDLRPTSLKPIDTL
jgi:alpha-1,3-mannosyl-glycoprotein beta-1,2-N-acetylglucosaminyltransferase